MNAKRQRNLEKHRQGSNVSPESREVMSLNVSTWDRAMKIADGDRLLSDVSWVFSSESKRVTQA